MSETETLARYIYKDTS